MGKRQTLALSFNITIFLLAVLGSVLCFGEIVFVETKIYEHGIKMLKFFTVQSNVLAGITALFYVIFFIRERKTKKEIPMFVHILRFVATIDLAITFLVVALFLGFITDEGYFSMYVNANFLFHFLIPVLNFVSFEFFEQSPRFTIKHTFWGVLHLILYTIFYLIVVLTHFNGSVPLEYDWYAFAQLGLPIAFMCAVLILGLGYLVSFLLHKLKNKQNGYVKTQEAKQNKEESK